MTLEDKGRARVVVVGAGFGGVETVRALRKAPVDVLLIDRRNHHLFQPLLYQVATAALSPGDIAWPIRSIFRRQTNVTVHMAEILGVDPLAQEVRSAEATWRYDYLVLATGARSSYFGHDEWTPYAPGLKSLEDATVLRRRLLEMFERAEATEDEAQRKGLLTIAIVGGGATGVEMAGAIAELSRRGLRGEFRRIDPAEARIILIEAGPRVLAAFPETLSRKAEASLRSMGVEIRTATLVRKCDETGLVLDEGEALQASTIIWAAGMKASPAAAWVGCAKDRGGRALVSERLSAAGLENVFIIGDAAAAAWTKDRKAPGVAPAAKQMGTYVGRVIAAHATGRPAPPEFRYAHAGDLAIIGRRSAVVALGRLNLTGLVGWLFWGLAHIWFLIGFRSRILVSFEWLWTYASGRRGARLILGEGETEPEAGPPS